MNLQLAPVIALHKIFFGNSQIYYYLCILPAGLPWSEVCSARVTSLLLLLLLLYYRQGKTGCSYGIYAGMKHSLQAHNGYSSLVVRLDGGKGSMETKSSSGWANPSSAGSASGTLVSEVANRAPSPTDPSSRAAVWGSHSVPFPPVLPLTHTHVGGMRVRGVMSGKGCHHL